jgi:hypothetical protein
MIMSEDKMNHNHYIYVESGLATNSQLIESINRTFEIYSKELEEINKDYQCNIISKSDGSTYGYGYMWVRDEKLFYILLGKNKDGTDLIIEEDDPDWKPDPKILEEKQRIQYGIPANISWYDIMIYEEELENKLKPSKRKRIITSPISNIEFEYNENQKKIDASKSKDYFKFLPAVIRRRDETQVANKLFSPVVPKNITENDLRKIFKRYSFSTFKNKELYPIITIEKKRQHNVATITFDPLTNDGLFALLMTRKIVINESIIYFDYYKDNR